jgi:hypothetical protein
MAYSARAQDGNSHWSHRRDGGTDVSEHATTADNCP